MKTKVSILIILAMIVLSTMGYSYACLNGGIQTNCYLCNCAVVFTKVITWDNEIVKDVGHVRAQISCTGDTIKVCIENAYPCYRAYVNYTIQNQGQCPIRFVNITIINPSPTVLEITATSLPCTWFQLGQTTQGLVTVHALQPARQDWQYTFQIRINVACQTVAPCSMYFWARQFSSYLCRQSDPQLNAMALMQYLNQITNQSKVFNFTGTQAQKFQQALSILTSSDSSSMEAKLKAELLALWLNYVAGWTEGWALQGMSAQQVIQGSEKALVNQQTTQYTYRKNLCDSFNNLGGG
jgi:hypothetical protein